MGGPGSGRHPDPINFLPGNQPVTGIDTQGFVLTNLSGVQLGALKVSDPVSGGPIVFVAASDTPADKKAKTKYVGDGVNDNVEIQAALDSITTGTVMLMEGNYSLGAAISLEAGEKNLVGEGQNVTILATTGNTLLIDMQVTLPTTISNATLSRMTLNGDSQTGGDTNMRVLAMGNCLGCIIRDVEVKSGGYYGVNLFQCNDCLLDNVTSHNNFRHGYHYGGDVDTTNIRNKTVNCLAYSNGVDGFNDRGDNGVALTGDNFANTFINCMSYSNTGDGFSFSNVTKNIISGCVSHDNSGDGAQLGGGALNDIVSNSVFINNGAYGITTISGGNIITSNIVLGNTSGEINNTGATNIVEHNIIT